ncbi:MAG TPA: hypothetical protein VH063_17140 [Gaiellaceae bacterium]|nr:hypothetical protein [Gaiellaceae bacterium]
MRGLLATMLAAAVVGAGAAAATPGATIRGRLQKAHYPIYAPPGASAIRPRPQDTFYTVADFASAHAFWFLVYVYATPAIAASAQEALSEKIVSGPSRVGRDGRTVFLGTTAPLNRTQGLPPVLPARDFARLVALAEGR